MDHLSDFLLLCLPGSGVWAAREEGDSPRCHGCPFRCGALQVALVALIEFKKRCEHAVRSSKVQRSRGRSRSSYSSRAGLVVSVIMS